MTCQPSPWRLFEDLHGTRYNVSRPKFQCSEADEPAGENEDDCRLKTISCIFKPSMLNSPKPPIRSKSIPSSQERAAKDQHTPTSDRMTYSQKRNDTGGTDLKDIGDDPLSSRQEQLNPSQ